jgi:hypothetical protein
VEEYNFRGQREDEEVLLMAKQHPWVMAKTGFIVLIMANLVVLSLLLFGASAYTSWIMIVAIFIAAIMIGYRWFVWWNGAYILTNQRIIRLEQKSLFHRLISEAELDRIQDVTTEIKGFIQTSLNFGTVHIQTASAQTMIDLTNIINPYEMQQKIVKAHKLMKNELPGQVEMSDTFETKPIIR